MGKKRKQLWVNGVLVNWLDIFDLSTLIYDLNLSGVDLREYRFTRWLYKNTKKYYYAFYKCNDKNDKTYCAGIGTISETQFQNLLDKDRLIKQFDILKLAKENLFGIEIKKISLDLKTIGETVMTSKYHIKNTIVWKEENE